MSAGEAVGLLASVVSAATPLFYAALGELVVERTGVLNLGVEGMMGVGALAGFAMAATSGSLVLGFVAAGVAGAALAALFAAFTLRLQTNQVASGLALTLCGAGLCAVAGRAFVGLPIRPLPALHFPGLSELPILGSLLFRYDALVYLSLPACVGVDWMLRRSVLGLRIRAIGEAPAVAHALGLAVLRIRFLALLFGGALSGIAGAYLSTAVTPMWVEGLVAGRGWIALALVVFGTWRPWRVLGGAYLFGMVTVLELYAQGSGAGVPSELLSMLPYLVTILVLVIICRDARTLLRNRPAALGQSFHAGD